MLGWSQGGDGRPFAALGGGEGGWDLAHVICQPWLPPGLSGALLVTARGQRRPALQHSL